MNVEIRNATKNDIRIIADILNAATQKLLAKGVMQWEYPWDEETVASFINDFYIVLCDGAAVGCFGLKTYSSLTFTEDNSGLYFYHLAVHPKYNGQGIGKDICRWVKEYSENNSTSIYLDCWAGNDKLRSFYTDAGYEYMGDFPEEDYFISAFKV